MQINDDEYQELAKELIFYGESITQVELIIDKVENECTWVINATTPNGLKITSIWEF